MCEETGAPESCRSFFQNSGVEGVRQGYTDAWIRLINRLEREKEPEAGDAT